MQAVPAGRSAQGGDDTSEAFFFDFAERARPRAGKCGIAHECMSCRNSREGDTPHECLPLVAWLPPGAMALMLTGGLRSAKAMAAALRSGCVDVIGLGRPFATDHLMIPSLFGPGEPLARSEWRPFVRHGALWALSTMYAFFRR
jgi:hypothetical protein